MQSDGCRLPSCIHLPLQVSTMQAAAGNPHLLSMWLYYLITALAVLPCHCNACVALLLRWLCCLVTALVVLPCPLHWLCCFVTALAVLPCYCMGCVALLLHWVTSTVHAGSEVDLDPYDNNRVMPLAEFLEHPLVHELVHNGAAYQVHSLRTQECQLTPSTISNDCAGLPALCLFISMTNGLFVEISKQSQHCWQPSAVCT